MSNPIDRAYAAYAAGDAHAAKTLLKRVLASKPANIPALFLSAIIDDVSGNVQAALAQFNRVVAIDSRHAGAHYSRARLLSVLNRHQEAMTSHDAAIRLEPGNAWAWVNRGNSHAALKDFERALADFDAALAIDSSSAQVHANRGGALYELGRLDEALASCDAAIARDAGWAEAWATRGLVLLGLKRLEDALDSCEKALLRKPDFIDAWLNRGSVLQEMGRHEEVLATLDRALEYRPSDARLWNWRGNEMVVCNRFDEAVASYNKSADLSPDEPGLMESRLHAQMNMCDWNEIEAGFDRMVGAIAAGKVIANPFALLAVPMSPALHKTAAQSHAQAYFPATPDQTAVPHRTSRPARDRIRLAYFSADFHNHPGMSLMAEIFELHDRDRFEIYAFSYGGESDDPERRRVSAGVDHFIDVQRLTDREAAAMARDLGIDVAVHRNGYTRNARSGIFAARAAPIQVNYLGYPGTLGADYIDYIIADSVLIPSGYRECYTEKVVYMPHSYQPNDRLRRIAERTPSRQELGLPEEAFVFCCFNNDYKLTPDVFDVWMRLLGKVPGSVLWLLGSNPLTVGNLRREAAHRGIDASRLIFAGRLPRDEHLARHRQADLFLDTFHYNAHTTASDALWTGLPVITKMGETFASRVAASLLTATGLPELITHSAEAYESLAVSLAMQADRLDKVRQMLIGNRLSQPLFRTDEYTRHLETAYRMMCERLWQGMAPDHIQVPNAHDHVGSAHAQA